MPKGNVIKSTSGIVGYPCGSRSTPLGLRRGLLGSSTEKAEFSHCMHAACSRVSESVKQPPAGTHSSIFCRVGSPAGALLGCAAAFPSCVRSILTDIYLYHACSCHEILSGNAAEGGAGWRGWQHARVCAAGSSRRLHGGRADPAHGREHRPREPPAAHRHRRRGVQRHRAPSRGERRGRPNQTLAPLN
jgi:hypothetical protein